MQYMLIIHNDADTHPTPGGPGWDELMAGYLRFNEDLLATHGARHGEPLAPPSSATTVRVVNGQILLTDGPFAETKEWMSGYYLVECEDLDDATRLAARIPSAAYGSVEIRPILNLH
jgi:hypothetical protein